jgi:hypothetical protein
MPVGGSQMENHRADAEPLPLDVIERIGAFCALSGSFIDYKKRGRITGDFQKIGQFGDGFECEHVGLDRSQDNIGPASCLSRVRGGVGRRVDDDEIDALTLGLLDGGGEPYRVCGYYPRLVTRASIRPFRSRRLRIDIDYGGTTAFSRRRDRQIQGNRCFANSALFRYNCYYIHVYTETIQLIYKYRRLAGRNAIGSPINTGRVVNAGAGKNLPRPCLPLRAGQGCRAGSPRGMLVPPGALGGEPK